MTIRINKAKIPKCKNPKCENPIIDLGLRDILLRPSDNLRLKDFCEICRRRLQNTIRKRKKYRDIYVSIHRGKQKTLK